MKSGQIPRRTFLRGLGVCIGLPMLESMARPLRLFAEPAVAPGGTAAPLRMAFVYVPNGANMADWTPAVTGANFELPLILQPLNEVRSEIQVVSGLAHQKAFANGTAQATTRERARPSSRVVRPRRLLARIFESGYRSTRLPPQRSAV